MFSTWTPKYVKEWPFRLLLVALGYYFTYFWGPGVDHVNLKILQSGYGPSKGAFQKPWFVGSF